MLKNYLITAFRNLKRHKVYSLINIVGLAVGSLVIAMLPLSFQSFKAARTNPVDTLREVG